MASATEQLKEQAGLVKRPITIHEKLEAMKPQIAKALPRHLSADRMVRIGLTCLRTNPDLLECTMESVMASIMIAAQIGLEPGIRGQGFLIPYGKNCTFVPGWIGIVDLVNRAGKATVWTGAVYQGDEFDWQLGARPDIKHKPCGEKTTLLYSYAVAWVKGSEFPIIEVWSVKSVTDHRNKYNKVGQKHYSFKYFEMYARKVPLLQVLKYVPQSIELATALNLDAQAEMGEQRLEIKDVPSFIEGTVVSSPEPDREPEAKTERVMCGDCQRYDGEHTSDCMHAKTAQGSDPVAQGKQTDSSAAQTTPDAPNGFVRLAVKIEGLTVNQKKPLRRLSVVSDDGTKMISCFHDSLIPILDEYLVDCPAMAVLEVSKAEKDGKTYTNLQHILEIDGVPFVNDRPAEAVGEL